jgi:hypothetical protein
MTDDVRDRFLAAIAAQLPVDRVKELHLFGAIRQAGVESGVAVVAVERDVEDSRYTIYTARYRLTLKGLDRGKWEISVTEEADAPLLTVDAVVRGVSRRSGDVDETVRISGDELRAALPDATRA